jgi:hypothetical protein
MKTIRILVSSLLLMSPLALSQVPAPLDEAPVEPLVPIKLDTPAPAVEESLDEFKPEGRPAEVPHPDFTGGITNKPSQSWYGDMYSQLHYFREASYYIHNWSKKHNQEEIDYYASWLYKSVDFYMKNYGYSFDGGSATPKYYDEWDYYPTRGDHNYYYYYYVRPLYYQVLREAKEYYDSGPDESYYSYFKYFADRYNKYTRCNYGVNGADPKASTDKSSTSFEEAAGLR